MFYSLMHFKAGQLKTNGIRHYIHFFIMLKVKASAVQQRYTVDAMVISFSVHEPNYRAVQKHKTHYRLVQAPPQALL